MNIKKILIFPLLFSSMLASCDKKEMEMKIPEETLVQQIDESAIECGIMRVQVNEELAQALEISSGNQGVITKVADVDAVMKSLRAVSMTRTFPYTERFETRTRMEGLHLWYDVVYDTSIKYVQAKSNISNIKGIVAVEPVYKIRVIDNGPVYKELGPVYVSSQISNPMAAAAPFNDPGLAKQWHYSNDGNISGVTSSLAGADINVFNAWKNYTAGSDNVIVAIIDGGIDIAHEDLAANLWINEAELNGTPGVDDDNNGYIDDIYGYNFVTNGYKITADAHGTHVAGTVGAVNNNGKGVCGVAGGNGTQKGVRLMSCQVFENEVSGNMAKAIKYAADNGAVIAQNSWGYNKEATNISSSDKAAIDYFIKYAGIDENGNQTGPMKGGIVIFAAGNDNIDRAWPAKYEAVLSVSAIAADYKKTYYSCFGDWVDIAAPGGDYKYGQAGMVYSTLPNNSYGYLQGTSMACPHVSGVAALIVSKYGKQGFTPNDIWNRLLSTTTNINNYSMGYTGLLGKGLVNATAALAPKSNTPPNKITGLGGSTVSNTATITFAIPEDSDDGKPVGLRVYYSKNSLSKINVNDLPAGVFFASYDCSDYNVGDLYSAVINGLDFNSTYYFAADASDYSGNRSPLSDAITCTVGQNNPPVLEALDGISFTLKYYETKTVRFKMSDPDNHKMVWKVSGDTAALAYIPNNNVLDKETTLQIAIKGTSIDPATNQPVEPGKYQANINLKDVYGAAAPDMTFSYTILDNTPPRVIKNPDDIYIGGLGRKPTLNIDDYIIDDDGESLSFSTSYSVPNIVQVNVSKGIMYVVALGYGQTRVTVTGKDVKNEEASVTFTVLVRDETQEVDIYPNPVTDYLNIRTGETGSVNIAMYAVSGAKIIDSNYNASPFSPAKVDVRNIGGGTYTVKIKTPSGKEFTRKVIKL